MAPWRVEGVEAGFHQRANRGESGENVPSFFFSEAQNWMGLISLNMV